MTFGARLIQLRKFYKLSQTTLGEHCDVTKSAVSQWESDSTAPEIQTLQRLRAKLDFSLDWLIAGDGPSPGAMRPPVQALTRVAEKLPDYAVVRLTREGTSYAELIEHAAPRKTVSGEN